MGIPFRKLWQLFGDSEVILTGTDAANAVFELAKTIDENKNSPRIQELASKIPTLLEALNSSLGQIVNSTVPFLPIAVGIINFYRETTKQEPTIAQIIAIVVQAAYLESIKENFLDECQDILDPSSSDRIHRQVNQVVDLEINDYQARLALVFFLILNYLKDLMKSYLLN